MVSIVQTTPNLADIVNYEALRLNIDPEFSEEELKELLKNEARHDIKNTDPKPSPGELNDFCNNIEKRINELISPKNTKDNIRNTLLTRMKLAQALYSVFDHEDKSKDELKARTAYILARAYFIIVAYTHLRDDLTSGDSSRNFYKSAAYQLLNRVIDKYLEAVSASPSEEKAFVYLKEMGEILNTPLAQYMRKGRRELRILVQIKATPAELPKPLTVSPTL